MADKAISPLRQRPIDDMAIRRLGLTTQHGPRQKLCGFRSPTVAPVRAPRCLGSAAMVIRISAATFS